MNEHVIRYGSQCNGADEYLTLVRSFPGEERLKETVSADLVEIVDLSKERSIAAAAHGVIPISYWYRGCGVLHEQRYTPTSSRTPYLKVYFIQWP